MSFPLVHRIALGGAGFSLADAPDESAAVATIRAAADAGIGIFDSARAYAPVDDPLHNEQLLRRALAGHPDVLIATKGGHFRTGVSSWAVDNTPDRLRRDVDTSLKALGVDRIGLFYLHRADGSPTVAESVNALDELKRQGKIAAIGLSNVSLGQLDEALAIARVDAVQNSYSVGGRGDNAVLERCEQREIPFFAYSPLGGSSGSGSIAARFPRLHSLAGRREISVQRLALAALLARSPVMSVVVGAGRPATAIDAAAAVNVPWDEEAWAAYEADVKQDPSASLTHEGGG